MRGAPFCMEKANLILVGENCKDWEDIMDIKEVQEFIKTNAATPEVQEYVKGFITPDGIKAFIETDEGMKTIQPKLDQHFTKGLETWKTNNIQKLVDEGVEKVVQEKYPKETEEQKRLRKLEGDLLSETVKRQKAEQMMQATQEANAKGLPVELVKYFVGADADSTKAGLLAFEQVWKAALKSTVDNVFKANGRTPDQGDKKPEGLLSREAVAKMSQAEVNKNFAKIQESQKHW